MIGKLYYAAATWTGIGLVAGLFYREFTKIYEHAGGTHLSLAHTHALALGTLFFLIALALEKALDLASCRDKDPIYYWIYNAGLALTVTTFIVKGVLQVRGAEFADHAAIAGMHGLGHILLTIGLVLFFLDLHQGVKLARFNDHTGLA